MNQLSFILFYIAAYEAIDQLTRRFWRTRRNETLFASFSVHILVKSDLVWWKRDKCVIKKIAVSAGWAMTTIGVIDCERQRSLNVMPNLIRLAWRSMSINRLLHLIFCFIIAKATCTNIVATGLFVSGQTLKIQLKVYVWPRSATQITTRNAFNPINCFSRNARDHLSVWTRNFKSYDYVNTELSWV